MDVVMRCLGWKGNEKRRFFQKKVQYLDHLLNKVCPQIPVWFLLWLTGSVPKLSPS